MATIQNLVGANKIKDEWQKINNNFAALNSAKVESSFLGSFGIGSNVTLRVSTDLNNEMNNGWVAVDPGITANAPDSSLWGVCRTDRRGSTSVYQTVYRIDTANLRIYIRKCNGGTWSGWEQLWHSGNDGAGSGLDADLLDGMQPSTSASANTIVRRDSNGRIKAAAPSASDDVARKAEVDGKVSKSGDTMTGDLSMGYTENGERKLVWETPGSNVYWYYHHSSSRNDFGIYDSGLLQSPFTYDRLTSTVKLFNNFEIYNDGSVLNRFYVGVGSPEGNITAPPGAIYQDKGSPGGLYIKDTGTGNMGWKKVQTA